MRAHLFACSLLGVVACGPDQPAATPTTAGTSCGELAMTRAGLIAEGLGEKHPKVVAVDAQLASCTDRTPSPEACQRVAAELAQSEAKGYGPNHPKVRSLNAQKALCAPADASCTAITNVRLFDGERVTEKTSVVVRDGKIADVGAGARCANTIDGTGKTLLPGLIDAHTHAHSEADLASALRYGVTTELDMFGQPAIKAKLRTYARAHDDVSDSTPQAPESLLRADTAPNMG